MRQKWCEVDQLFVVRLAFSANVLALLEDDYLASLIFQSFCCCEARRSSPNNTDGRCVVSTVFYRCGQSERSGREG